MEFAFYFASGIAVVSTLRVVTNTNPVHALLYLIISLIAVAMTFFSLGAPFAGVLEVIAYAGAIMVLFVFTIMLLNAGEEEVLPHTSCVAVMLGVPGLIVGLAIGVWVIVRYAGLDRIAIGGPQVLNGTEGFGNPRAVAHLLFRDFLLPFEVTSILVLIAILGAVVLARREE